MESNIKKARVRKLTENDSSNYVSLVKNTSKRYKHLMALEKKSAFDEHTTPEEEFRAYMKNLRDTPDMTTKETFQRITETRYSKDSNNRVTYEKYHQFEKIMCDRLLNVVEDAKQHLFDTLMADYSTELDSFYQDGFMSVDEFRYKKRTLKEDPPGVYVLHNISSDVYYVGQAARLYFRVNQHLSGTGNKDIHADMEQGDIFEIKLMKLSESPYESLSVFEREMIRYYDAYDCGYNKTKGNVD